MGDNLTCTGCGEYVGAPISDRTEELEAEVERLREGWAQAREDLDEAFEAGRKEGYEEAFQMYVDANEECIDAEAKLAKAVVALDRLGFDWESDIGEQIKEKSDG